MDEYYKILGVSPDADDAEIETAYQNLKAKYSRERFEDGEVGNNAAKNLTKLNEAYEEIIEARKYVSNSNNDKNQLFGTYDDVSNAIKKGDLNHAQDLLDGMSNRDAEWHYLESVIFYKKNWMNESKRQLEIAMDKDPKNVKYKEAYEKLCTKMHNAEARFTSGNANFNNGPQGYDDRQMGGDGCLDICATTCCVNMLCNMCCR